MPPAALMLLFFVIAMLIYANNSVGDRKALFIIDAWANSKELDIEHCERRYLRTGPFFFMSSKYQRIYYMTVCDRQGRKKTVWLKLGGYFTGMLKEEVEAIWE